MTANIYRHAESTANAGLPTDAHDTIPLTPKGQAQAQALSERIVTASDRPDLFVTSPFLRTQQTAGPTRAKFPDVPHETWPVEEFTYLASGKYKGTTFLDRSPAVKAYWDALDTEYVDGPGAESFNHMAARIEDTFKRLGQQPERKIFIFSHGLFMRAMFLKLIRPELEERAFMAAVRDSRHNMKVANIARMDLTFDEKGRLIPGFSPAAG